MSSAERPDIRSSWQLLVDRDFGVLFWGKTASNFGTWSHNIVAAIVMYEVTGSAFLVGLISVAQFLPQIVLTPFSGVITDRGNAKAQLVAGHVVSGLGALGLAGWIWAVGGTANLSGPAPILISALVVGIGFVIFGPPSQAVVPSLVRREELPPAMALNSVPMTVSRSIGPALGAIIATQLGAAAGFAVAGAAFVACGLALSFIRLPAVARSAGDDLSLRSAAKHVWRDRPLFLLLLAITAVGAAAEPAVTLAPAITEFVGGSAALTGWIASAFGGGAAVGLLLLRPMRTRYGLSRSATTGLFLMGAGLAVAALPFSAVLSLTGMAVGGVGMTLGLTNVTTLVQMRAPAAMRGRVMALWFLGFLGARPLGSMLSGFLTDISSVAVALLVTAAGTFLVAWLSRPKALGAPRRPPPGGGRTPPAAAVGRLAGLREVS
ncbi:MFS transporter [Georgenia sp. AZ-5]|uniref:MFS transporter n=1 Tax=Georgenia sp. AZ-5 TaxID=3367526 RepID=UPI00375472E3